MEKKQFSAKPKDIGNEVTESLPPQFHEAFARVVKAGMRVIFSKETHDDVIDMISQNEGDIGEALGQQIASLMVLLYEKSNKTMPGEVIVPAGVYLLAEGAEFLEQVTGEEIDPSVIAVAMQTMINSLMGAFGIDPNKFYGATEQALSQYQQQEQPA